MQLGESESDYCAEGVERGVVLEKVEGLLEARKEKHRWALPKAPTWKRHLLRPVYRMWSEG